MQLILTSVVQLNSSDVLEARSHLATFVGVVSEENWLVCECAQGLNVKDSFGSAQSANSSTRRLLLVLRGTAVALRNLHAQRVVHRDVHAGNVVFDAATGVATLIDFGLSRSMNSADSYSSTLTTSYLPEDCLPAEALTQDAPHHSPASDMWMFGLLVHALKGLRLLR